MPAQPTLKQTASQGAGGRAGGGAGEGAVPETVREAVPEDDMAHGVGIVGAGSWCTGVGAGVCAPTV